MATRPEEYSFSIKSSGINFALSGISDDSRPPNVVITVNGQAAHITLKALTVMVASLNHAKNKHTDIVE